MLFLTVFHSHLRNPFRFPAPILWGHLIMKKTAFDPQSEDFPGFYFETSSEGSEIVRPPEVELLIPEGVVESEPAISKSMGCARKVEVANRSPNRTYA